MFEKAGAYSNRSSKFPKANIYKNSGQFRSQKTLSRETRTHEFNHLYNSTNNASQIIETQAERARDLERSRKVIEEYLSDVKKRTLTVSTGTGTYADHMLSYKSLPPVHGVEAEKNIQDSTLVNLSESLIKSVIKQVKKEKDAKRAARAENDYSFGGIIHTSSSRE